MPVPWFEKENNLSGKLTTRISTDFKNINFFSSNILTSILFLVSNVVVSIVFALYYEWRTALTSLALLPMIGIAGFIQLAFIFELNSNSKRDLDDSSQIVSETVQNIRTVLTLGKDFIV